MMKMHNVETPQAVLNAPATNATLVMASIAQVAS